MSLRGAIAHILLLLLLVQRRKQRSGSSMQRLVSYDCSSSSESDESALGKKRLKRTVARDGSEVSSSVVQDEPNGLTAESTGDRATILLEMGCSYNQVIHAISIWGQATPVEDLFDFIQANGCSVGGEITLSKNSVYQEAEQLQSREAHTLPIHITNSWEKKNCVMEVRKYIHAPCFTKEASCSRSPHVQDTCQDEDENASAFQELERMGFTSDLVHRASEECNSIDIDVLLEHLIETTKEDLNMQNQTQSEVESLGPKCQKENRFATPLQKLQMVGYSPTTIQRASVEGLSPEFQKENRSATPLQKLQMMGYSMTTIERASDECNSIDFDVLLEYLMEAEEEDSQNQEHSEVDSSEEESSEIAPVKQLQEMGFPLFSIKEAMETSGHQDFEGLLNVLSASEYIKNKGNLDAVGVGREPLTHISTSQEKDTCASLLKRKFSTRLKVGSSRCQRSEVKWAGDVEKLWYTYIDSKKKRDLSSISESEDSEINIFESAWEEKSRKPRRGKKKVEFLQPKKVDPLRSMQGKMMGFGIPGLYIGRPNPIPQHMQGPPYFYFENVACVPNNQWDTIKRHFNGVDPEFTDSKFFSATRRPRGYVHNLPIENRSQLLCVPPMTIFEALPDTQKYWPGWDTRDKLNCINIRKAPDTLCSLIRRVFRMYEGVDIPCQRQQEIVQACKNWNLVWVGPGQAAPLEPFEIELLLGFDRDHTRGCSSMIERYDALGNAFQVNTVAYHLSPLKCLYPDGITVLSLFSGIGGAEVALDKLRIHLKLVIAVEINEKLRGVLASWWKKSGQTGELKLREDVRDLTDDALSDLIDEVGRIDLIIGGSPCNNLSGNNQVGRVGLCEIDSSLFFEFTRIFSFVRQAMHERGFV